MALQSSPSLFSFRVSGITHRKVLKSCLMLFSSSLWYIRGFPGGAGGKEPACQSRRHTRLGFDPWVGKIPWRRAWRPTPIFLPGESHGQKGLVSYRPIGSQRVGHNWSDFASKHACILVAKLLQELELQAGEGEATPISAIAECISSPGAGETKGGSCQDHERLVQWELEPWRKCNYCWRWFPSRQRGRNPLKAGQDRVRTSPITDHNSEERMTLRVLRTWVPQLVTSSTLPVGTGFWPRQHRLSFQAPEFFLFLFARWLPRLLLSSSLPWLLYASFISLLYLWLIIFSLCPHKPPPDLSISHWASSHLCLPYSFLGRRVAFFCLKEMSRFLCR